jgi:hypothetical protein
MQDNMQEMTKFTHSVELADEELDLIAAGGGCGCRGSLVNISGNDIDVVQANVAGIVVGPNNQQNF